MPANNHERRSRAYTASGVNINSGYLLVQRIKDMVKSTRTPGVISDIGGFGGLFKPDLGGMKNPVLVGSADGVGTKLKLAIAWKHHLGVGVDLVAMSVNDILVQGALPLFFLDYFGCGKLEVGVAEEVIAGVAEGCRQSSCALLGGETAEMPGMYADGDYDLAGFCVGLADQEKLVDGSGIQPGDVILGLASTGIHSNGYSLVRKLLEKSGLGPLDPFPGLPGQNVRDTLLAPTRIYVPVIKKLLSCGVRGGIKGMAHITGGGFYENIPRTLPANALARVTFSAWPKSPIFPWLKETGELAWPEMLQIFNCGIGFILILPEAEAEKTLTLIRGEGQDAWRIGEIAPRLTPESEQVEMIF